MYKKTTIIKDNKEIAKLFTYLRARKVKVLVILDEKEYLVTIEKTTPEIITLFYKGSIPETVTKVDLQINHKASYFAVCNVLKVDNGELLIETPSEVKKGLKRKYNRFVLDREANISISIINDLELDIDALKYNVNISNDKLILPIYETLTLQNVDIYDFLTLAIKYLNTFAKVLNFKIYADKDDKDLKEDLSKEVPIIKTIHITKKAIFIPDVYNVTSYICKAKKEYYTSLLPYIETLNLEEAPNNITVVKDKLLSVIELIKNSTEGIISYICAPIIASNDILGYISLSKESGEFSLQELKNTLITCEIIAQQIRKINVDNYNKIKDEVLISIVDLSAGGVRIKYSNALFKRALRKNSEISISINIEETIPIAVQAIGKVLRIYEIEEDNEINNIKFLAGDSVAIIEFTNIESQIRDKLDTYINRKIEITKMSR